MSWISKYSLACDYRHEGEILEGCIKYGPEAKNRTLAMQQAKKEGWAVKTTQTCCPFCQQVKSAKRYGRQVDPSTIQEANHAARELSETS